jgi:hypothetical protein
MTGVINDTLVGLVVLVVIVVLVLTHGRQDFY